MDLERVKNECSECEHLSTCNSKKWHTDFTNAIIEIWSDSRDEYKKFDEKFKVVVECLKTGKQEVFQEFDFEEKYALSIKDKEPDAYFKFKTNNQFGNFEINVDIGDIKEIFNWLVSKVSK